MGEKKKKTTIILIHLLAVGNNYVNWLFPPYLYILALNRAKNNLYEAQNHFKSFTAVLMNWGGHMKNYYLQS